MNKKDLLLVLLKEFENLVKEIDENRFVVLRNKNFILIILDGEEKLSFYFEILKY